MHAIRLGAQPDLDRAHVGGKAAGINTMMTLGIPVPPAFVLPTTFYASYRSSDGQLDDRSVAALKEGIGWLEQQTGRTFGSAERPLLVSVRSGAAWSMPGMMDTVLNLGMNPTVAGALAEETEDESFAIDTHRRFHDQFERIVGHAAPADPVSQLAAAASAVFESWDSSRAIAYRSRHGIPQDAGTAVTVQAMVFGNIDDRSGTGVLFSRDPLTGADQPYGEWLPRGQGEDVVSGRFDPQSLAALGEQLPDVHSQLLSAATELERLAADIQDIEFTVESGRLWLLQTRTAKRSPDAALRLAVSLHRDGLIDVNEAVQRVSLEQLNAILRPRISPETRSRASIVARGEPACPGVASGIVVTDVDEAERLAAQDVAVVLARPTTDPDDVHGMLVAAAILTEIGGSTSHAAVVSREIGTPCVVGCGAGELMQLVGREVTVDAHDGTVFNGVLAKTRAASEVGDPTLTTFGSWARRSDSAHARALVDLLDQAVVRG